MRTIPSAIGNRQFASRDLRYAICSFLLSFIVLILATGCELVGFVGQTRAQAIALKQCSSFRLTSLESPVVRSAEWLTVEQAEARGLSLGRHEPNSIVWVITLEGRWQLQGRPPLPEGAAPVPNPIFQRCVVVLDARTGELFETRAGP